LYLEEIFYFKKYFFGFGLAHLLAFIVDWQQKKLYGHIIIYISHICMREQACIIGFQQLCFSTCVISHCSLAIYIKKSILRQKEELWKTQIFFTMQKCILQKIL
jgi:hypothetical protein